MENIENKEFVRIFTPTEIGILYTSLKFALDNNIFEDEADNALNLLKNLIK